MASTGQILTELAEGLKDSFHITVICTVPSYTGRISQHYKKHKYYYENINGINVLRIRVPEFRKSFAPSRLYNIAAYFISAIAATLRIEEQDYVFTISQPPVLGGLLGVIGKRSNMPSLFTIFRILTPNRLWRSSMQQTGRH